MGGRKDSIPAIAAPLAILAGAIVLRCVGLGHREFWHDEYCSLLYASAPEGTLRALRAGGNPPLYFLLLRVWMDLFGTGEAAARALSVLFSAASIGALGLWLRSLEVPRRSILWSMTLAAVAPLHLFYAREARGYALVLLVLGLALWSFTEALQRGGAGWWALHGFSCLAGFYTHNLLVPFIAAFWLAAGIRRAGRRAWGGMLAAHGLALVLYVPWVFVAAGQARWIARFWEGYPPFLAIPRSLLAFGVGGPIPMYIAWPSPAAPIVWLSGGFFAAAALFAFAACRDARLPRDDRTGARARGADTPDERALGDWLVFLFVPLLGLWLVSVLAQPVYLVGRYDLVALPAFLGLAGAGIGELQRRLARYLGPASVAVPAAIVAVLAAGAILPRYRADAVPDARPNAHRADLLAKDVAPGDLLVSLDLAASNVLFLTRERGIDAKVVTFPAEILEHWGWFNAEESVARGPEALTAEAAAILEDQRRAHPGARVWVLPHLKALNLTGRPQPGNAHQELFDLFIESCRRENLTLSYPAGADARDYGRVGIIPLAWSGGGS